MRMVKVEIVDYSDFITFLQRYLDSVEPLKQLVKLDGYTITIEQHQEYMKLCFEAIKGLRAVKAKPKKGIQAKSIQEVRKEVIEKVKTEFLRSL
ncbi:hypothetical protein OGA32_000092 [Salmonella enterica]|nr:hypothetical protein [Salmonella enterica]